MRTEATTTAASVMSGAIRSRAASQGLFVSIAIWSRDCSVNLDVNKEAYQCWRRRLPSRAQRRVLDPIADLGQCVRFAVNQSLVAFLIE